MEYLCSSFSETPCKDVVLHEALMGVRIVVRLLVSYVVEVIGEYFAKGFDVIDNHSKETLACCRFKKFTLRWLDRALGVFQFTPQTRVVLVAEVEHDVWDTGTETEELQLGAVLWFALTFRWTVVSYLLRQLAGQQFLLEPLHTLHLQGVFGPFVSELGG